MGPILVRAQPCSCVYYEAVKGGVYQRQIIAARTGTHRPAAALFRNHCRPTKVREGHRRSSALDVLPCLLITQTRTVRKRPRQTRFKCFHPADGLASGGLRAAAALSERITLTVHCQLQMSQDFGPKHGEHPPHPRRCRRTRRCCCCCGCPDSSLRTPLRTLERRRSGLAGSTAGCVPGTCSWPVSPEEKGKGAWKQSLLITLRRRVLGGG